MSINAEKRKSLQNTASLEFWRSITSNARPTVRVILIFGSQRLLNTDDWCNEKEGTFTGSKLRYSFLSCIRCFSSIIKIPPTQISVNSPKGLPFGKPVKQKLPIRQPAESSFLCIGRMLCSALYFVPFAHENGNCIIPMCVSYLRRLSVPI